MAAPARPHSDTGSDDDEPMGATRDVLDDVAAQILQTRVYSLASRVGELVLGDTGPTPDAEAAAKERLAYVASKGPKRSKSHTLAAKAQHAMSVAAAFQEQLRPDDPLSQVVQDAAMCTVQSLSAGIRNIDKYEQWTLHNPLAPCQTAHMERAVALPTSTDVPCMHCAEPFSTPPVVLLRPHYDDQNKYKPRQMFEGCFCSGPCMLAYYDECGTNSMMLAWAHASCDALKLPLPQEAGPKALQMRGRGGSHAPVRTALTVPTAEALAAIQAIPCPVAVQRMTVDQEVRSHERYTAGCSPTGARLLTDEGHAALDALGVPREASGPCTHCAEAIPDGQRPVVLLRRADIHDTSTKPRRVSRWAHDGTFCSGSCLLGFYAQRVDEETYELARQTCAQYGLRTPHPVAPPNGLLRGFHGPLAPQRHNDLIMYRTFRDREIPTTVAFNTHRGEKGPSAGVVSRIFARTGGNPRGLTVPRGDDAPAPLQPTTIGRTPIIQEYRAQRAQGVPPSKVKLRGITMRAASATTSKRRTRIKDVVEAAHHSGSGEDEAKDESRGSGSGSGVQDTRGQATGAEGYTDDEEDSEGGDDGGGGEVDAAKVSAVLRAVASAHATGAQSVISDMRSQAKRSQG